MRVKELVAELLKMDQEALVEIYAGYDYEYGDQYKEHITITQEPSYILGDDSNIVYID